MKKTLIATVSAAALLLPAGAWAQETIKIGVLVALEGVFAEGGKDGVRGVELALKQHDGMAGGKKVEIVVAASDATPDTALRQARKLIEQDGVDFIIGPLSGSEGVAMRDYAKTIPDKTIINGISGALETTWVDPAPNFFRFNLDGSQWGSGLGSYVVNEKGWKKIATVAADYSFGYTNFLGFAVDFCKAGGDIVERFWVPLGSSDFAGVIAAMPDDVDAIYLGVGGTDAINFLNQYEQAGDRNQPDRRHHPGRPVGADRRRARPRKRWSAPRPPARRPTTTPTRNGWNMSRPIRRPSRKLNASRRRRCSEPATTTPPRRRLLALDAVDGDLSDGQAKFHGGAVDAGA